MKLKHVHLRAGLILALLASADPALGQAFVTQDQLEDFRDEVYIQPPENIKAAVHSVLVEQGVPQQIAKTNDRLKSMENTVEKFGETFLSEWKKFVEHNAERDSLTRRIIERQGEQEEGGRSRKVIMTANSEKIVRLEERVDNVEEDRKNNRDQWAAGKREVLAAVAVAVILWLLKFFYSRKTKKQP